MTSDLAEQRLKSRSIQPTAMRLRVLKYLSDRKATVSLFDLEQHFSHADRTTLYRTLKTFQEHGVVHQIYDESGSTKYGLCAENCTCSYPNDMHAHFYCSACENTFCFQDLSIPQIDLPDAFKPAYGNFVITGLCPDCSG
jgi:Fur family ferric uptake transcriptional regulator